MNILAQIFGFFGLIMTILSYLNTKKDSFLLGQILSNIVFAVQYLLLGAFSAVISIGIAFSRNFVFLEFEKNKKEVSIKIFLLFELIVIIFGIITFDGFISLFPVTITLLFSYASWQKNLKITYSICIIVMILYIIYNFYIGAYVAIFSNFLELIASYIGLKKILKIEKKEETS